MVVLGPHKTEPGTNVAYTQGANINWYTTQTYKYVLHDYKW